MKILIIQNKYMGDVLMSSTIANNLKRFSPSCTIHFLCYAPYASIIKYNPNIDYIIKVDEKKSKPFFGLVKITQQIRNDKYDILIDAYEKFQSKIISKFSGIKMRISYPKKNYLHCYTHSVKRDLVQKTAAGLALDHRLSLIDPIVGKNFSKNYTHPIFLKEKEILVQKETLKLQGIQFNKPIIMLGVLGSKPEKTYPLESMGKIINEIFKFRDVDILFNYIPSQKKEINKLMNYIHPFHHQKIHLSIIGNTIREFAAIMYHCRLHISNEGGGCHISKALNKPTFTLFSPYIKVEDWHTFSNNPSFDYIDLKELKPDLFSKKSQKQWRKNSQKLYEDYDVDIIINKVNRFITKELKI